MNILEDPRLKSLIHRRNISESRAADYKVTFNQIYELINKTPSELIEEAKQQQQPDWEKKRFLEMEERNVTKYLEEYYNFLKNVRKNKDSTIKLRMTIIRSFYSEYEIKLPKPVILSSTTNRTRKTDIPSWDDVETVVTKLESKKYIAIVYFFATSGIRSGDVCNLTIGDFLKATEKYHNGTLEDLLTKDPYEYSITPAWDFDPEKTDKKGNLCLTSNTPQAIKALFDYLEDRIKKGHDVSLDSALFRSNRIRTKNPEKSFFYKTSTMSDLFKDTINPIFDTHENNNTIIRKDKKGYSFFRPHNLRTLFKTTCSTHLPKAMLQVEEKGTLSKNIDILSLLTGHEPLNSQITKTYEAVDYEDIAPYYYQLIPYLTTDKIKVKDMNTPEYLEMKKEVDDLKAKEKERSRKEELLANIPIEILEQLAKK
ncbi:MAG: hypothetical protein ACRC1M_06645 [Methanobacteriaceae archaeon]